MFRQFSLRGRGTIADDAARWPAQPRRLSATLSITRRVLRQAPLLFVILASNCLVSNAHASPDNTTLSHTTSTTTVSRGLSTTATTTPQETLQDSRRTPPISAYNIMPKAKLAIVIDDIGYSELLGMKTIRLPGRMTLAVLPFAPHTRSLVPHARRANKDIIIHQPMEPHPSPAVREEVGTLKLNMSRQEFDGALADALAAVPESSGLSNHTGSLLTAHAEPMTRVMRKLNQRNMYFLDSRTTAQTVALDIARDMGVPALRRDVFLDHIRTRESIQAAFHQALVKARKQGHAVLVGHPYPVTLQFLEYALHRLPADIELVSAADLAWAGPHTQSVRPAKVSRALTPARLPSLIGEVKARPAVLGLQPHQGSPRRSPAQ